MSRCSTHVNTAFRARSVFPCGSSARPGSVLRAPRSGVARLSRGRCGAAGSPQTRPASLGARTGKRGRGGITAFRWERRSGAGDAAVACGLLARHFSLHPRPGPARSLAPSPRAARARGPGPAAALRPRRRRRRWGAARAARRGRLHCLFKGAPSGVALSSAKAPLILIVLVS